MDIIPKELLEIIISYLGDPDDVRLIIETSEYPIDWNVINYYRFNLIQLIKPNEYLRNLGLIKFNLTYGIESTLDESINRNFLHIRRAGCSMIKEIALFNNLIELKWSHSELKYIPRELFELTKLQNLSLAFNKIEEIPGSIGLLSDLEFLILNNNRILRLPANIGKLTKLRHLDVRYNKIEKIPDELFNLDKCDWVFMYGNQIKNIPENLKNKITH